MRKNDCLSNNLVTIITVSYNASAFIERTILSVIHQTYPYVEYIIIDGGSTDGTIDIINEYSDNIACWISESDSGVYDAMNKGVRIANGNYIIFMNSGDIFVDNNVLSNIFFSIREVPDVIYGNTVLSYSYGKFLMKPEELNGLIRHMVFCHQSCLVKSEILKKHPFNYSFKIAADYNLFYNLYVNNKFFVYVDIAVSVYEAEYGLSSSNPYMLYKEYSLINSHSCLFDKVYLFFSLLLNTAFKNILPKNMYYKLMILQKKKNSMTQYGM